MIVVDAIPELVLGDAVDEAEGERTVSRGVVAPEAG